MTHPLSAEVEALVALDEKRHSKGDWFVHGCTGTEVGHRVGVSYFPICVSIGDSEFIAAAPRMMALIRKLDEALRQERAEVARLTAALNAYGKHPEECDPQGEGEGACVSHMAYLDMKAVIEAEGWYWDDVNDQWCRPARTAEHRGEG